MIVISDCAAGVLMLKKIPENPESNEFSGRVGPGGATITIEI